MNWGILLSYIQKCKYICWLDLHSMFSLSWLLHIHRCTGKKKLSCEPRSGSRSILRNVCFSLIVKLTPPPQLSRPQGEIEKSTLWKSTFSSVDSFSRYLLRRCWNTKSWLCHIRPSHTFTWPSRNNPVVNSVHLILSKMSSPHLLLGLRKVCCYLYLDSELLSGPLV